MPRGTDPRDEARLQRRRWPRQLVGLDGTNDFLSETLVHGTTKTGLCSFWIDMGGSTDGTAYWILTFPSLTVQRTTGNRVRFLSGGALDYSSGVTLTATSGLKHLLASWNCATGVAQMYVDDVSSVNGSPTVIDAATDYSGFTALGTNAGGTDRFNGKLGDFYFNPDASLDLSKAENRRKFIDGSGNPVFLGANGLSPTGASPQILFSGGLASWQTNKGTGGGFTLTGALGDGGT